jgi:hypothetical protein
MKNKIVALSKKECELISGGATNKERGFTATSSFICSFAKCIIVDYAIYGRDSLVACTLGSSVRSLAAVAVLETYPIAYNYAFPSNSNSTKSEL